MDINIIISEMNRAEDELRLGMGEYDLIIKKISNAVTKYTALRDEFLKSTDYSSVE